MKLDHLVLVKNTFFLSSFFFLKVDYHLVRIMDHITIMFIMILVMFLLFYSNRLLKTR